MKFSANLGFLWSERALPDAVAAAAGAGFDAVECHWPFATPAAALREALQQADLPMLSLNTPPGDRQRGDFGLCALADRQPEARAAIDQSIAYAAAIGCRAIHVMPGLAPADAEAVFARNLEYALSRSAASGIDILIEPINQRDAPGYHLSSLESALALIRSIGDPRLRLMFDCYHIQILHGDLLCRLHSSLEYIGHIQIAAVPSRHEPDEGEIAYPRIIAALEGWGYAGWIGAEYRPRTTTEAGLGWLHSWRAGHRG